MFPKVPQSSLGILRVPQLPPPLEHLPPPKEPDNFQRSSLTTVSCLRSKVPQRTPISPLGSTTGRSWRPVYQEAKKHQSQPKCCLGNKTRFPCHGMNIYIYIYSVCICIYICIHIYILYSCTTIFIDICMIAFKQTGSCLA